jgi:hypothetical protein
MPLGAAFFSPCTAAWVALFGVGALQSGERVLISGASGAVGSIAVQLARAAGARVAIDDSDTTASFDLLVDTVGGPGLARLLARLVPGGRAVLVGYTRGSPRRARPRRAHARDVRLLPLNMLRREAEARAAAPELLARLADGRLTLALRTFALPEAAEAMAVDRRSAAIAGRAGPRSDRPLSDRARRDRPNLRCSGRSVEAQHQRSAGVARGAAGEHADAAAAQAQRLDQLDDAAQAGRPLRMAVDEPAAERVHRPRARSRPAARTRGRCRRTGCAC